MPCSARGEELYYNKEWYGWDGEYEDMLTAIACSALHVVEDEGLLELQPPWAQKWYAKHKELDDGCKNG